MLRSLNELRRFRVTADDGDIGSVSDFVVDDEDWTIRYLVVDTGGFWRGPHRVQISPTAFVHADWSTQRFHLSLTRKDIQNSPPVDLDQLISREFERGSSALYYGWPYYLGFAENWSSGPGMLPDSTTPVEARAHQRGRLKEGCDSHLRSVKALTGYHVQGSDQEIGHIADFVFSDESWDVRYLVIDTRNWWFGKRVLVPPCSTQAISWITSKVYLDLSREMIQNSPQWSPETIRARSLSLRIADEKTQGRPFERLLGPPAQR